MNITKKVPVSGRLDQKKTASNDWYHKAYETFSISRRKDRKHGLDTLEFPAVIRPAKMSVHLK